MRPRRRRRVRVHFLDVGRKEYGDAVLCDLGGTSVLIDGAHPGDQVGSPGHPSIPEQIGDLLEQAQPPYEIDLLIVTHAHQDHIGCLPHLVEHGLVKARWALVADPRLGWGRRLDDAGPEPVDSRVLHLASALREEVLSDRSDDAAVAQFLVDAANLEQRYGRMLAALEAAGTKVVRYVGKRARALETAFDSVGLRVLGPSEAQLLLCAKAITDATRDAIRAAQDMLARDDVPDAIDAYRRLVTSGLDAMDARDRPGPPINLQSVVTSFELGGVKLLFAGDMQLADPQTGNAALRTEVRELREKLRAEAPFDLVKISHHGSDNAFSAEIADELGATPLYGICAGEDSTHHPNRRVLRLLDERRDRLQWVRTDRNGLSTVELGGARPKLTVAEGDTSDATPNVIDLPPAPPAAAPAAAPAIVRAEERDDVEVIARIPHTETRVSVTVEVSPGLGGVDVAARPRRARRDGMIGGGRDLSNLLFVTSRDALAANIGRDEAARLLERMEQQGLSLLADVPRGDADSAGAAKLVREQLRRNRNLRGVVLLGGYDVVPARKLNCIPDRIREAMGPSDDPDDFVVWNDDGYGDREGSWRPEVPVTRVPDGRSEDFLLAALEADEQPRPAPRRGIRNVARPFAEPIFAELPGDEALFSSEPTIFDQAPPVRLDADHVYLMLHGDFLDATRFWGEQTANEREAVNLTNIPSPCGRIVFTGCCWGALITDQPAVRAIPGEPPPPKLPGASIALTFLERGATAFVGCTGAHYSPTMEPFGYFGGPMHQAFWRRLQGGSPPAEALFEAKREYAMGMPHGRRSPAQQAIELKILHQFTCLGLGW